MTSAHTPPERQALEQQEDAADRPAHETLQPHPELFVRPESGAYADCAQCALPLRSIATELRQAPQHWQEHSPEAAEEARTLFATLIGASADDIALTPSTTYGMATLCREIPLARGQRVVMMANEHPSQVLGWLECCRAHGAEPAFIGKPANGDWTSALIQALSEQVAVVCFAPIHWRDGTFVDSTAVAARARQVGARVVIDGTQAIGALPFDIGAVAPDFVVASGYKWLLGPTGIGYLYVHPRHQGGDPVEHGWSNRVPLEGTPLWSEGDLIYPRGYTRGARRFDAAGIAKSLLPRLAIPGLRQLLRWTPTRIHEYLRRSNTSLAATLPQKQVRSPDPAHGLTHILGIELDANAHEDVAAGLKQAGIAASIRGNILRVSPHLWNTEEDMQQLCAALRTIL